jgi:penicillin-binding protein 1A
MFVFGFRLCLLVALSLGAQAARAQTFDLPPIDRIVNYQPKLPLQVFTTDGVELAQFGDERREYVPLARTPKLLQSAVLAVEDARFREHSGIDLQGMARAALAPLLGRRLHGASTITQQLVRTMLLSREFTVERKTKEIILALRVEEALSKDRILEIYLNEIYLGSRAYGFASAAKTYFGKSMDQLSIAEAAMLAGLPQNPHYANPITNMARATARQHTVIGRMVAVGVITDAQAAQAKAEKIVLRPNALRTVSAGHAAEMARLAVVERFGAQAYSSGLRVTTSLRAADQRAAVEAVARGVLALERRGPYRGPEAQESLPNEAGEALERAAALALKDHRDDDVLRVGIVLAASPKQLDVQLANGARIAVNGEGLRWAQAALIDKAKAPLKIERGSVVRLLQMGEGQTATWAVSQWPQAEAALAAIDTRTGRVRALVGGFDFARQPFNNATQGFRQPGSAYKAFVYSAALEERVMPGSIVDDLPFIASNGWNPSNSYNDFTGPMGLRDAMARSSNMVSIRLTQHATPQRVRDWSARFGLDAARQPDNLTLALGTGAATPLQMARGFAVFANGGWRVNPVVIERITDAQGKVVFEAPPPDVMTEDNRAISGRNAWLTTSLLGEVTQRGTAARVNTALKRSDLYGKTGTTDDAVDAWFVGFHPTLSVAVWMGHPKPKSMGDRESGSRLALPIWIDYMSVALRGVAVQPIGEPPAGVVRGDNDWLYTEWAQGGWVTRIAADSGSVLAPTVIPGAPAASTPVAAPAAEPASAASPSPVASSPASQATSQ